VPAPWRDVSDILVVTFRHLGLKAFGPVLAFTLNLSPEVEALARSQSSPVGWLHDRISHQLERVLMRPVEFHLVLEEEGGRLHIHGEFQIAAEEAKDARAALRAAGGKWDEGAEQKQSQTTPNPDVGWLNYITESFYRVSFTRNFLPRFGSPKSWNAITFKGSPISSTLLLKQRAASIYEAHRQLIMGRQKLARKRKSKLT
jgi:hypothetical protein